MENASSCISGKQKEARIAIFLCPNEHWTYCVNIGAPIDTLLIFFQGAKPVDMGCVFSCSSGATRVQLGWKG